MERERERRGDVGREVGREKGIEREDRMYEYGGKQKTHEWSRSEREKVAKQDHGSWSEGREK